MSDLVDTAGPGGVPVLAEHLRLALEAGGLGTWRWDLATGVTVWDERLEALYGLPPGGFGGSYDDWLARQHPDDVDRVVATVQRAVRERGAYVMDHRVVWPDGSVHWLQGRGQVVVGEDGQVLGTIGCVADVTDRMLAEQERDRLIAEAREVAAVERLHRERLEFLGRVNDALRLATDQADLMRRVARTAVPRLGDWCVLYVLPPGAVVPEVEVAHVDPAMEQRVHEVRARFPFDPDAPSGVAAVLRTGESQHIPEVDDEVLARSGVSEEAAEVVRELGLRSSIIVPLRKRNVVLGALQLVTARTSRAYDADDLALAESVAIRIASSLENLRLHDQQREIALTLQKSLLPAVLPAVPGVELAVRYWAAGEGTEVGGDFYDAFAVGEGCWGLALGDVCGSGPEAASVTAMARHTIRAGAWHGDDPSEVLLGLNGALRAAHLPSFVTALYGELRPADHRLDLALAGHPPPVLVSPDGEVAFVGRPGTVLGPFAAPEVRPTSVALEPGSTLVLYTDGLTDVRPPHGLDAEDTLALVREVAGDGSPAEAVADRLHARVTERLAIQDRADDIALLVVRTLPRPAR